MSDTKEYDFDFGKEVDSDYVDVPDAERATCEFDDGESCVPGETDTFVSRDGRKVRMRRDTDDADHASSELDCSTPTSNDGRSKSDVFFHEREGTFPDTIADEGPRSYMDRGHRLWLYNEGVQSKDRETQNRIAETNSIVDTFAEYLDITNVQRERTRKILQNVPLQHIGSKQTKPMQVLGAMTIVCQTDGRFLLEDDKFESLMVDVAMSKRDLKIVRRALREKSDVVDNL